LAGIYIHIPFCKKACNYCDFHFSTNLKNQSAIVEGLLFEIEKNRNFFSNEEEIKTIYFGGGTPSYIENKYINLILEKIKNTFTVNSKVEVTMECNPDDINLDKVNALSQMGINRLSLGIQSMNDKELMWMNRAHNSKQSTEALKTIQNSELKNFSTDIIFATPYSTLETLKYSIDTCILYNAAHISIYGLTIEPRTKLHKDVVLKKETVVDDETYAKQYFFIIEYLAKNGYEQYEISNFSKPGFQSKHNSAYWNNSKYLGIGPSAHSFNHSERKFNISNNSMYLKNLYENKEYYTVETLNETQQQNEYLMLRLRTKKGIDFIEYENLFGLNNLKTLQNKVDSLGNKNQFTVKNNTLSFTKEGFLMIDSILVELFI
jgi:oxygen-independent coproporphyrinogen III oxidase